MCLGRVMLMPPIRATVTATIAADGPRLNRGSAGWLRWAHSITRHGGTGAGEQPRSCGCDTLDRPRENDASRPPYPKTQDSRRNTPSHNRVAVPSFAPGTRRRRMSTIARGEFSASDGGLPMRSHRAADGKPWATGVSMLSSKIAVSLKTPRKVRRHRACLGDSACPSGSYMCSGTTRIRRGVRHRRHFRRRPTNYRRQCRKLRRGARDGRGSWC